MRHLLPRDSHPLGDMVRAFLHAQFRPVQVFRDLPQTGVIRVAIEDRAFHQAASGQQARDQPALMPAPLQTQRAPRRTSAGGCGEVAERE